MLRIFSTWTWWIWNSVLDKHRDGATFFRIKMCSTKAVLSIGGFYGKAYVNLVWPADLLLIILVKTNSGDIFNPGYWCHIQSRNGTVRDGWWIENFCLFVCFFFLINGVSWPIREEVECNNMTSEAAGELRALCHAFSAPLAGYDCSIPVSDYFYVVFYRWHKSLSLAEEYLTLWAVALCLNS